jgi:hypothetical protein
MLKGSYEIFYFGQTKKVEDQHEKLFGGEAFFPFSVPSSPLFILIVVRQTNDISSELHIW